jgi:cobalt/nickel transport system permease protein
MVALSCVFLALFFGSGEPLIQISLPWTTWTIYKGGILIAVNTFFSVVGSLSCLFFLVLTTSITDLSLILKRAHVPTVLVELALLIYRYIFMFMEISHQMTTAQKLRLGGNGWLKKIRGLALLAGTLFIRTLEQGERVFVAMNARGYDGNIYVLEDFPKPKKTMIAAIVLFDVLLVIAIFLTKNIGVILHAV